MDKLLDILAKLRCENGDQNRKERNQSFVMELIQEFDSLSTIRLPVQQPERDKMLHLLSSVAWLKQDWNSGAYDAVSRRLQFMIATYAPR
jgi:hypothetical protein